MGLAIKMRPIEVLPTYERVSELLEYRPKTGLFYWLIDHHRTWAKAGNIAGTTRWHGKRSGRGTYYCSVGIDRRRIMLHRVAFLLMNGEWPSNLLQVHHIDGDGTNNRWANLQLLTQAEHSAAEKLSGLPWGVKKVGDRFQVRICFGTFDTLEEATIVSKHYADEIGYGGVARPLKCLGSRCRNSKTILEEMAL